MGHGYYSVFSKCLDGNVEWVKIRDPYIRAKHQVHNLVRFCEMLVKHCKRLRKVELTTMRDVSHSHEDTPVSE